MTDPVSVTQDLLPCPFCGGEAAIESQPSYSQAANTYNRYRAWCDQCGFGLDWHGYEPDAITAWNTRPTPDTRPAAAGSVRQSQIDASRYVLARCAATHQRNITVSKAVLEIALGAAAPTPDAAASTCTVPPPGWHCTRIAGHDGPCAAIPDEGLEDEIADTIDDSLDMDWTGKVGARAVMALLRSKGMVA